jgi:hypothetical protein
MLFLPLGLRLHYRRRDELVVGRRRRAHPSPAHGLNRAKSEMPNVRNRIYASRERRAPQRYQRWSAVCTGSGWREGSAPPVGLCARFLVALIPAPCHPLKECVCIICLGSHAPRLTASQIEKAVVQQSHRGTRVRWQCQTRGQDFTEGDATGAWGGVVDAGVRPDGGEWSAAFRWQKEHPLTLMSMGHLAISLSRHRQ